MQYVKILLTSKMLHIEKLIDTYTVRHSEMRHSKLELEFLTLLTMLRTGENQIL